MRSAKVLRRLATEMRVRNTVRHSGRSGGGRRLHRDARLQARMRHQHDAAHKWLREQLDAVVDPALAQAGFTPPVAPAANAGASVRSVA